MGQELATTAVPTRLEFPSETNVRSAAGSIDPDLRAQTSHLAVSTVIGLIDFAMLAPIGVLALLAWSELRLHSPLACVAIGLFGGIAFASGAAVVHYRRAAIPQRTSHKCLRALLIWGAVVVAASFLISLSGAERASPTGMVAWFVLGSVGIVGSRFALEKRVWALCQPGRFAKRVALVGSAAETRQLAAFLERSEQRHQYRVAGVFIDEAITEAEDEDEVTFGKADSLPFVIGALKVDMVIAAPPWGDRAAMNRMCERLRAVPANVHLLTEIAEVNPVPLAQRRRFAGRIMVELWTLPLATWRAWIKRAEDVAISVALLTVLSPAMILIALLIRLDGPGPVIFRQLRYGFANRPIRVSKFRTMRHDLGDATGGRGTVRNDPRVTKLGAILRRTSLDELPQLIDVLRGDMSLVGPRAHPVEMRVDGRYYADAVKSYATRHLVKPGMTGLAQINGCRGHVDTRAKAERRVEYDLEYIESWSLLLDLRILWRSVFVGFVNENAY